ncbi:MAG: DUF4968 domain-containing protein [Tannerella sp.]|jgi:alpha-D-xyloside xylohydrolase|nr:DUF4968 domain-containing protein [Tannerella sp.]
MKINIIVALFLLFMFGCDNQPFQQTEDGVIVNLKPANNQSVRKIRLKVVTDEIIRVTATNEQNFPVKKSLITAYDETKKTDFEVIEENNRLILKTKSLKATVSLQTGEIQFTDTLGNMILAEKTGGGKTFSEIVADGVKGYSTGQIFESPDDEAFYGLGQHQSDEFNYKGKNESLYQYNTKVSIPFVISTKNYGILWDNYSLTKFGDTRDYANLNQFKLYDKNGREGGLTASYLKNGNQDSVFMERIENEIDYENLETVKKFPADFPFYNSLIVWEGDIEPSESGIYRFLLYYAGYTKVYVDNELVVPERWRTAWNPNSYKFNLPLESGKKHKLRLEWKPDGGVSYIGLKALSPRPEAEQNQLSLWSEMGDMIDYYFIKGDNMDDVISGYRTVTGKSQIMPKWAMGFWQSRERYKTQYELIDILKEYRKRQIPIDNIVQDWSYWSENAWGSHDFDVERFPDPVGMVDSVHLMKGRIMISVWPKFYITTENYKAFDAKDWMYQQAVKDSVRDWIGKGYIGSFYDAYSEDARKLFWEQMNEKLYSKGIDAWWMDASEPDILSNASMDYRKKLMNPTALGPSTKYFNAYALVNAMAIYDGQRSVNPNNRVFLLTRSGFPGLQRYSTATWSGDIGTRWEDMKAQISAGINFSMSGIPYWTMDIGGFCVERRYERAREGSADLDEWRELNARWFQFGAFCPLFRSHGQYPYREIFNLAPENHPAYKSMVYYDKLRYRLMPYIYTLAGKTWFDDYTIMRGLPMDFAYDPKTHDIGDQYMFGSAMMVCPVYQYKATSREVYFPQNTGWYDFESNKYISGGQTVTVSAPYERIPLFVREGSIIPMGNDIQSTQDEQNDYVIKVYTGKDGEFTLYNDEGVNYNYEKGGYYQVKMVYSESAKTLTIGSLQGDFSIVPESARITVEWITKDGMKKHPEAIHYQGNEIEIKQN